MLKDPTAWMDDLEFYIDDEGIVEQASAIEPTLLFGGTIGWIRRGSGGSYWKNDYRSSARAARRLLHTASSTARNLLVRRLHDNRRQTFNQPRRHPLDSVVMMPNRRPLSHG